MTTLATSHDNDLIVQDGTFQILDGKEAALALARSYAQTLMGEMIHAMTNGVRFFETAYNRPRLALFEHDFRRRVLEVPDVIGVRSFDARVVEGELRYTAQIVTRFGEIELEGPSAAGYVPPRPPDACAFGNCIFGMNVEGDDLFLYEQGSCDFSFTVEGGDLYYNFDDDSCIDPSHLYIENGYLFLEV